MSAITLQFVREAKLTSAAIAWFTQGEFSHVDAVLPDGRLLGCYEGSFGDIPPGVQIRPVGYRRWARQTRFTIPVTDAQHLAWQNFLLAQIGKPYDWRVIAGFVTGLNWRAMPPGSAWVCSQVQAGALEAGKIVPALYLSMNKIAPNPLALLVSGCTGVSREDVV